MKKLLSILSICLVFISCSPDRVIVDELTKKGDVSYFEGKPFTGVVFDVYEDGQLMYETIYKDGKRDGLAKGWYDNGQLEVMYNYKDGDIDGLYKRYYYNGQLKEEANFKDGEEVGTRINYKDGVAQ
tara:strand:- start:63 stop:443 length:381 start_codon:yes stop_codon:yes gene_type:complete